jgi:hypothetical protein
VWDVEITTRRCGRPRVDPSIIHVYMSSRRRLLTVSEFRAVGSLKTRGDRTRVEAPVPHAFSINSDRLRPGAVPTLCPASSALEGMPSDPPTRRGSPSRAPSYLSFVPRRSPAALRASFDNLVALADAQERLRGAARAAVWRDRGEPVKELRSLEECLKHAGRGGLSKCRFHHGHAGMEN